MLNKTSPEVQGKFRQLARVLMSYVDFQQTAGIADYILSSDLIERYPENRFALQGLNCAMIIAYSRPFSGNDSHATLKVPDLPSRLLKVLSNEERSIHNALLEGRHTILAHSDSDAWEPQIYFMRMGSHETLVPSFNYVHSPYSRKIVGNIKKMANNLREACSKERGRLEPEVRSYLPVLEINEMLSDSLLKWGQMYEYP